MSVCVCVCVSVDGCVWVGGCEGLCCSLEQLTRTDEMRSGLSLSSKSHYFSICSHIICIHSLVTQLMLFITACLENITHFLLINITFKR